MLKYYEVGRLGWLSQYNLQEQIHTLHPALPMSNPDLRCHIQREPHLQKRIILHLFDVNNRRELWRGASDEPRYTTISNINNISNSLIH